MARRLGTGWRTIMRAVVEVGTPLVADQQRRAGVTGIGVDEHAWQHPNRGRPAELPGLRHTRPPPPVEPPGP
jgi:hypothetical protein